MHKLALSSILAASLLACGGNKNNNGGVDAPGGGSGSCTAASSYSPDFSGAADATFTDDGSGNQSIIWDANLNSDPMPDVLEIDLYSGYGAFGSALATGTYTISGAETTFDTCGLCGFIYTNVDGSGNVAAQYFWNAGTVTLTSVTPTTFSGSLQNIQYREVNIDPSTFATTDAPDGCKSSIGSASFSVTLDDSSGSGSGSDTGSGSGSGSGSGFVGTTSNGRAIRFALHHRR